MTNANDKTLNSFEIEFSKEAKKFINDEGIENINIKMLKKHGWGGPTIRPEVQAGAPEKKEINNYQLVESEELDIYIANNIIKDKKRLRLRIKLTGFWFAKKLYLSKLEEI